MKKTTHAWITYVFRLLIGTVLGVAVLLFVTGLVFMVPSVQTRTAQKVARHLSKSLETTISIEKLRLLWNLDIAVEGFCVEDHRGNAMLSVGKLKAHLPSYNSSQRELGFSGVRVEDALVRTALYKGDEANNMTLFFRHLASDKKKKPMRVVLNNVHMKNGTYVFLHEKKYEEDTPGCWNYRHIRITDIQGEVRKILVADGACILHMKNFSMREHSGFSIEDFQGELTVSSSLLAIENCRMELGEGSRIDMDYRMLFDRWKQFQHFNDSVAFDCRLRPSTLCTGDLRHFSPKLLSWGRETVALEGVVKNSLSHMAITQFRIAKGDSCLFQGDILSNGLPDAMQTYWTVRMDKACAKLNELNGFQLPGNRQLHIPERLLSCRIHEAQGHFNGSFLDFSADISANSNWGQVEAEGNYQQPAGGRYRGRINTKDLKIQHLLQNKLMGNLTAQGEISGKGGNIDEYRLSIASLNLNGREVKHVKISGDMEDKRIGIQGDFQDPELKGSVKGFVDLQEENIAYGVAEIDRFNLSAFHLFREDSAVVVSLTSKVHLRGNQEERSTDISLRGITYTQNGRSATVPPIQLAMGNTSDCRHYLQLNSRPLQASLDGNVGYSELLPCLKHMLRIYLPQSFAASPQAIPDSAAFDATIQLKSRVAALELLLPQIRIGEGLHARIHYDRANSSWETGIQAPKLAYRDMETESCSLHSYATADTLHTSVECGKFAWNNKDSLSLLQKLQADISCFRDTLAFAAYTDEQPESAIGFTLRGALQMLSPTHRELHFQEGGIRLQASDFALDDNNLLIWKENGIQARSLRFASGRQDIALDGFFGKKANKRLLLLTDNLVISNFEPLLKAYGLTLDGIASGKLFMLHTGETFRLTSDLQVDSFAFNGVQYGKLEGKAEWEEAERQIGIHATLHPEQAGLPAIQLLGHFQPDSRHLNLESDIRTLGLQSLAPYLSSFSHTVSGIGSGNLRVHGTLPQLHLSGKLHLDDACLGIGYINTVYRIRNQEILIQDSSFLFDKLLFTDEDGHEGRLSGYVSHQQLTHFGVHLDIDADNVMVLNTTYKNNDLFYGKAYGIGEIRLRQRPQQAFHLIGNVRTGNGTVVTILPGKNASVQKEQSYIVFEKPYSLAEESGHTENANVRPHSGSSNTNVQINLSITSEATVKVVLPPSIGCTILGNGSGNLRLELMDNRPFEIYGNYTLAEGNVDLALGKIFTRTLNLENGSSLSWNGMPDKGRMDVRASYTTKTSVTQLLGESASSTSYRSVPVTTGLHLNGELLNPESSFRISLDEVDESLRSLVYNALDTTDKEAMFRQAFSLMLLGRFETQSATDNNNANYLGYSLSELFSHYLQKMMSTLTENVNLGFLYRPGDGISNGDEYNVQISTNLMENRLIIKGNLDIYEDNNIAREKQAVAGNVVGDIIIEYKINPDGSLRVKAFNMANYYDVLSSAYSDVPYYQGIGIGYTKDFNTLRELFSRKKK